MQIMISFLIVLLALLHTSHTYQFGSYTFDYKDISGTGTLITSGPASTGTVTLGTGGFPFFGNTVTQFAVSTNGFLDVDTGLSNADNNRDCPFVGKGYTRILVLHDNLNTNVYHETQTLSAPSGDSLVVDIIQWKGVHAGAAAEPVDFQVLLFANGEMVFQYLQDGENGSNSAVGVVDNFNDVLVVSCNGAVNSASMRLAVVIAFVFD